MSRLSVDYKLHLYRPIHCTSTQLSFCTLTAWLVRRAKYLSLQTDQFRQSIQYAVSSNHAILCIQCSVSVCLSVCLSHHSIAAPACGGFAAERLPAAGIDWYLRVPAPRVSCCCKAVSPASIWNTTAVVANAIVTDITPICYLCGAAVSQWRADLQHTLATQRLK